MCFECLNRGECDGVPLGQPDDLIALTQGYRRLGLSTEAVSAFQFQLLAVKRSWAAANKDVLMRFVRAIASSFRGSFAIRRTAPRSSRQWWR